MPFAGVLLLVASWGALGVGHSVRARLGLRVVVQLDRALRDRPTTYFSGEAVARHVQVIERALGAPVVSSFIAQQDWGASGSTWFDAAAGGDAVGRILERLEDVPVDDRERQELRDDLERILAALERARAERARFRLVVVAGEGMNGMLWAKLSSEGF